MATCEYCGTSFVPTKLEGDGWPERHLDWYFVCWTPGDLNSARYVHRPQACRDVLREQRDAARAEAIREVYAVIRTIRSLSDHDADNIISDVEDVTKVEELRATSAGEKDGG